MDISNEPNGLCWSLPDRIQQRLMILGKHWKVANSMTPVFNLEPETSQALALVSVVVSGSPSGHDVIQERLEQGVLIMTAPSVGLQGQFDRWSMLDVSNPSEFPDPTKTLLIEEPC